MHVLRWIVLSALLGVGCGGGGGGGGGPDAPGSFDASDQPPDAASDRTCTEAPTGELTVEHQLAGVTVVSHGPDGCVLDRARTNAFGLAQLDAIADGMVTVVVPEMGFNGAYLVTVVGVQ